ncbi:MAG: hypothetical protein KH324_10870 [Ruminococcus sp.]|nr:hypothetical protein [Ruminococcus sp.]
MAKFDVLKKLDNYQYTEGCPVFITGGNLLKKTDDGQIYCQFRLRSLSPKVISAVIITINCFDIEGTQIEGVERYQFLDLKFKVGDTIETKSPVHCPDSYTRRCKIIINTVVFDDDTKWLRSDENEEYVFGLQEKIADYAKRAYFCEEMKKKGISADDKCGYIPAQYENHWICFCGLINPNSLEKCVCGIDHEALNDFFQKDNVDKINAQYNEQSKRRELEHKRRLNLEKEHEEEKRRQQVMQEMERKEQLEKEKWDTIKKVAIALLIVIIVNFILSSVT